MGSNEPASWRPDRLECERLASGAFIGTKRPRLSWRLAPVTGDDALEASQILVASTRERLESGADIWDSGWLQGATTRWRYGGTALRSRQHGYWTVRVRTRSGATSDWAEPAELETGLLDREDWTASWIARPPSGTAGRSVYLVRRRFVIVAPVATGRAYVSALGVYRLWLNGALVGDGLLRPGWTDYRRRVQYERVELGAHLRAGTNVLAAELGAGWYAGRIASHAAADSSTPAPIPELIAQIELEGEDGQRTVVATDESWEWSPSPIASSDLYDGEDWDLRLADSQWAEDGSSLHWEPVERTNGTSGALVAPRAAPVRVIGRAPATVSFRRDGTALVDSGRNDTGYLALKVSEPAGRRIEVAYGEVLDPAGNLYRDNLRSARCTDTFVCSGAPEELLAPAFSFRGYRYAEIRGLGGPRHLLAADSVSIGSDLRRTGWFRSGETLLEDVYELMVCSLRANYLEVPTDCPQRDERMGWLADALLFAPIAAYTFDIGAFMAKWLDDVLDARTPEGAFADIAPRPSARWPERSFDPGAPAWADAGILLPWLMYERYGDEAVLEDMYPAIVEHLDLVHRQNPDAVWRDGRGKDYGDWVPAGPDTSHDLFATSWLYRSTAVTAEIAGLVGDQATSARLASQAQAVREAFHRHFVDAKSGRIADPHPSGSLAASYFAPTVGEETQTGYVMALALGLLEGDLAQRVGKRLAALMRASGGRLQTGFCGSAFLPAALERAGFAGMAYDLLLSQEPPSLGFMVRMGATSVWERWDGLDAAGAPACPTMNSFNHYAMSSMLSWLVEGVCGLRPTPGAPALSDLRFAPAVSRRVPSAEFQLEAPAGHLETGWSWDAADRIVGRLHLPPGTRASIARTVSVDDDERATRMTADPTGLCELLVGPGDHEVVWSL